MVYIKVGASIFFQAASLEEMGAAWKEPTNSLLKLGYGV